jgi:isopenicillin-N epimerase
MLDSRITFLNHGSFGAVPRTVFDAQTVWRRRIEAEPIELLGRRAPDLIEEAKKPIGAWLGMEPSDFGFVTNATEGVNAVLQSLQLGAGDELLTTNHVYPAVRQSMRNLASRCGASYREVELNPPFETSEKLAATVIEAVGPSTRLLVIDHVTSPTAIVLPVEAIAAACALRGVEVLVDGAHAPGMLRLDVARVGATYYTGNLHKWMCAPKGAAFLWVSQGRQHAVHPLIISHYFEEGFAKEFGWQGTRDISAWLTAPAAIAFMAELGWDGIRKYNHELVVWVQGILCEKWGVAAMSPMDGRLIGSMATVPLPAPLDRLTPEQSLQLQQTLYSEHQMEVPVMFWNGRTHVRPCCQVYNVAAEYERLGEIVARMMG